MKHLYKIVVICGLLMVTSMGVAKTSRKAPPLTFTINSGQTIVLHGATSNAAAAYQWYLNGTKIPGAVNKDYTTGTAGSYTVMAFNAEGCPSQISDEVVVTVVNSPPIVIVPPPSNPPVVDTAVDLMVTIQSTNTQAKPGQDYSYVVTANNNSVITGTQIRVTYILPQQLQYLPQTSNIIGNVTYNPTTRVLTWSIGQLIHNTPITLTVPVEVLQPGSIKSAVDISGKQPDPILANNVAQVVQQVNPLIIPNVFTPNGDGVNDTFVIPGLDTYTANEITIINRWGNDVYEKKNYKNDWTGNGLVEGTYFYVLKVLTSSGEWDSYKGYVTLLRTRSE
jgi:gliding motility-associated-like protein/uncharacterized repeat protein (TIGR01451 family)